MIIIKKIYKTKKKNKSLIKQNGGAKYKPKTPSIFKTQSAKQAQTEYKQEFGNMAKAETLLEKYTKANSEIKNLETRLGKDLDLKNKTVNQMTVNETKAFWKTKDATSEKKKEVPKSIMGRIGRTFSNFGTAISRKSRLLKKSMNRWGNERVLSSKQKQLENTKKKMNAIITAKLSNTDKQQLTDSSTMKEKSNAITKALNIKKKDYEQTQKQAQKDREAVAIKNKEEINKRMTSLEIDYKKKNELKQAYLILKNSKNKDDIKKTKSLKKEYETLKKDIKEKQEYIQLYNKTRFQPVYNFDKLENARQKSIFNIKSKRLRHSALEQINHTKINNEKKKALVKKYRTPEYQTKAAETKAQFEVLIRKKYIPIDPNIIFTDSLSDIKTKINNLPKINSVEKAILIEHYRNLKVENILNPKQSLTTATVPASAQVTAPVTAPGSSPVTVPASVLGSAQVPVKVTGSAPVPGSSPVTVSGSSPVTVPGSSPASGIKKQTIQPRKTHLEELKEKQGMTNTHSKEINTLLNSFKLGKSITTFKNMEEILKASNIDETTIEKIKNSNGSINSNALKTFLSNPDTIPKLQKYQTQLDKNKINIQANITKIEENKQNLDTIHNTHNEYKTIKSKIETTDAEIQTLKARQILSSNNTQKAQLQQEINTAETEKTRLETEKLELKTKLVEKTNTLANKFVKTNSLNNQIKQIELNPDVYYGQMMSKYKTAKNIKNEDILKKMILETGTSAEKEIIKLKNLSNQQTQEKQSMIKTKQQTKASLEAEINTLKQKQASQGKITKSKDELEQEKLEQEKMLEEKDERLKTIEKEEQENLKQINIKEAQIMEYTNLGKEIDKLRKQKDLPKNIANFTDNDHAITGKIADLITKQYHLGKDINNDEIEYGTNLEKLGREKKLLLQEKKNIKSKIINIKSFESQLEKNEIITNLIEAKTKQIQNIEDEIKTI